MRNRGIATVGMADAFATVPVVAIAVLVVVGVLLVSPAYGFHRDELYLIVAGQHASWEGYRHLD